MSLGPGEIHDQASQRALGMLAVQLSKLSERVHRLGLRVTLSVAGLLETRINSGAPIRRP
jgi:hypothetical protein